MCGAGFLASVAELDGGNVVAFLRRHQVVGKAEPARVAALAGGVSSNVFRVSTSRRDLVVKQPLRTFRVKDEWIVDRSRILVEAEFATRLHPALPTHVLRPVLVDARSKVVVYPHAGTDLVSWKGRLLGGRFEPRVARDAGRLLATIHRQGRAHRSWRARFARPRLFRQQRLEPYFIASARRNPRVASELRRLARHVARTRFTLVHGDFSPKNLLTDGRRLVLVDHEVATWGEPWFDVAFLINHLLLKAHRRPQRAQQLIGLAQGFLDAYRAAAGPRLAHRSEEVAPQLLAALMLARVDGKSPVEYLGQRARARVRVKAIAWLENPPADLDEALGD